MNKDAQRKLERLEFLRRMATEWADAPGGKLVKCHYYARDVGFLLDLLDEVSVKEPIIVKKESSDGR